MLITNCQNASGQVRVYLGPRGSLECWIEPSDDGRHWSFHWDEALAGNTVADDDIRQWASTLLMQLATALEVRPDKLRDVPFKAIQALHIGNPFEARRVPASRRQTPDHAFMATAPHVTQPMKDSAYAAGASSGRVRR